MPRRKRFIGISCFMMLSSFGVAIVGCGSTTTGELSQGTVIDAPFEEARTFLSVTSAPVGAEVWVGPGTTEGSLLAMKSASSRLLGRTPLRSKLVAEDVSPEGDLEYSVRHQAIRRDGRIANASRIIELGGSVRIHADLHNTLTEEHPTTQ
jgi:hypothetical protein